MFRKLPAPIQSIPTTVQMIIKTAIHGVKIDQWLLVVPIKLLICLAHHVKQALWLNRRQSYQAPPQHPQVYKYPQFHPRVSTLTVDPRSGNVPGLYPSTTSLCQNNRRLLTTARQGASVLLHLIFPRIFFPLVFSMAKIAWTLESNCLDLFRKSWTRWMPREFPVFPLSKLRMQLERCS